MHVGGDIISAVEAMGKARNLPPVILGSYISSFCSGGGWGGDKGGGKKREDNNDDGHDDK